MFAFYTPTEIQSNEKVNLQQIIIHLMFAFYTPTEIQSKQKVNLQKEFIWYLLFISQNQKVLSNCLTTSKEPRFTHNKKSI